MRKAFFTSIWTLPQTLLGYIVVKLTKAHMNGRKIDNEIIEYYVSSRLNDSWSGVSLGQFIIFSKDCYADETSIRHEYGHQIQSLHLGWLYLLIIGIPSFLGNVWDRIAHESWSNSDRIRWYYNLPWERTADYYGGVKR